MTVTFTPPALDNGTAAHHSAAAILNTDVTTQAIGALQSVLDGEESYERILLKAAAGAGKSHALRRMVAEAVSHASTSRIGVTAFANKQVFPLAGELGTELGKDAVCLLVSKKRFADVPTSVRQTCTVVSSYTEVPPEASVVVATTHMIQAVGWRIKNAQGAGKNGERLFDVLFIDEAWQLPLHRFRRIDNNAPVIVGVGDVGQLPPLDASQNPWRGDAGYNPYRAWPTAYDEDDATWAMDMPAVWRPTAAQLPLWRAFYADWDRLDCVAAPGDRVLETGTMPSTSAAVWEQVASGVPTLLEVSGLAEAEAADIDMPLMSVLESLLHDLIASDVLARQASYDAHGTPDGDWRVTSKDQPRNDPMIAVLATRNQAVDDAQDVVDRLIKAHDLPEGLVVASTVDSWQGQTNAITVAIHPLSGASALDDFNSAFGRLAVTCTRATHGLLLLSRTGLDDLLANAPARPGTPLGEPGSRQLPRQTHRRILSAFARGTLVTPANPPGRAGTA